MRCDVCAQVLLESGSNGVGFVFQPSLETVAAAAAAVVDGLMATMTRSLVVLSIPSLNM